jgi:predicted DNA repair protein MutK
LSIGLIGLIDDVVGIAKLAAASLDDATAQAGRAGVKAAGIVVDDTAVTPRYVVGFAASRELPMIARITVGSLRNKLLILLPAALLLSLFAPWAITPLLMAGGLYLCFEGAEKVIEALGLHQDAAAAHGSVKPGEAHLPTALLGPEEEAKRVKGAIRTDFILSAEIMAITLAAVATSPFVTQAIVLAIVGLVITLVVYGAVALIVKADDIGLALANRGGAVSGPVGRAIVRAMPTFLHLLSLVGTAAMLWVGGGIILHGLEEFGLHALPDAAHGLAHLVAQPLGALAPIADWLVNALAAGVLGLALGAVVAFVVGLWHR